MIFVFLFLAFSVSAEPALGWTQGESAYEFSVYFQPEAVYAKNIYWLNNRAYDEVLYVRHYLDLQSLYTYRENVIKAKAVVRSRTLWGYTPGVLCTTQVPVKEFGVAFGTHKHGMWLSELWIRELWLEGSLNDFLGLPFCNFHTLTIGAFPFELGRGISLGSAYPNFPPLVAVDIDTALDQYAFGAKLSGELSQDHLWYDIYGAIFKERALDITDDDLFERTCDRGTYGYKAHPFERTHHCGLCDFAVAARLRWEPLDKNEEKKLYFEPYLLVYHTPAIKIEFSHEGKSTLVTLGLAGEHSFNTVECGFECAFNRGGQEIFGLDRNKLVMHDNEGIVKVVNDKVIDNATDKDALVTQENEKAIRFSLASQSQNGRHIRRTLKNKPFRFQDPYCVRYRGFFFIADLSFILLKDICKVSCTWGYATGDSDVHKRIFSENVVEPCKKVVDCTEFISVNETYIGKRVVSALFLNGVGAFPRPTTFGSVIDSTASLVGGFTNLVLTGFSCDMWYRKEPHRWHINPNVLFFWQEYSPCWKEKAVPSYLGAELNCITEVQLFKDFSFYAIAAVFLPGSCYKFLTGVPLTSEQVDILEDRKISHGFLGHDPAYLINFGIKYTF